MSAAEIADNRWELESCKPPTTGAMELAQIAMMVAFAMFTLGVVAMAVLGTIQGPQKTQLERTFEAGK